MDSAEHKQVMVTWPGGGHKTGPHTQTLESYEGDVGVRLDERTVIIPFEWVEPVKPEIEEGRLVYVWDNSRAGGLQPKKGDIAIKYNDEEDWENFEPVHKRWNELTDNQKEDYRAGVELFFHINISIYRAEMLYRISYNKITGEDHP